MIVYERVVRFEEVDAAGIMFFARYANIAHEAIEHFFGALDGGYPDLINRRKIGLPIVRLEAEYRSSLRYGDTALIETSCRKIGRTSAVIVSEFHHAATSKGCASVLLTVACASLVSMESCPMPDDVRAHLTAHLQPVARHSG